MFLVFKPHEVYDARAVGGMGHDSLLARSHVELLEGENLGAYLHEGHLATQLGDGVEVAAVDVFIGEVLQQVAPRVNAELLLQNLGTPWTNARQELDVLVEDSQLFS